MDIVEEGTKFGFCGGGDDKFADARVDLDRAVNLYCVSFLGRLPIKYVPPRWLWARGSERYEASE